MIKNNKVGQRVQLPKHSRPAYTRTVQVGEEGKLIDFLTSVMLKDRSRTTIKQVLHDRLISVGGVATTQFDTLLAVGDVVALHATPLPKELTHPEVKILWQDDDLILIYKSAGVPTVASGIERDKTALQIVSEHLKKFNPRAKVYLLNRLDKDSSGYVLMAKSEAMQALMSKDWEQYVPMQTFAVLAEGIMTSDEGELNPPTESYEQVATKLKGRRRKGPSSTDGVAEAGYAHYRVIARGKGASLLICNLQSGRNNRLRKQLAQLKHPIWGDFRAGSTHKMQGRVALEGIAFALVHPKTGQRIEESRPVPALFRNLLKQS